MNVWKKAIKTDQLKPGNRGCVKFGDTQIGLFHFEDDRWYAVQNRCPHKGQNVISRGIIGDAAQEPVVACALHKNKFSLVSGKCLTAELPALVTYPVKIEGDDVLISLT